MPDVRPVTQGISRSLRTYYGSPGRAIAMERFYGGLVKSGDLVFDIGAHVGDRVRAFRRLGARVIAVEPQQPLARVLRLLYGRDPDVVVERVAVGRANGSASLRVNVANPTISTASSDFIAAAAHSPQWAGQRWTEEIVVPMTTLDSMIARHGRPSFLKIDIEGFEAEALAGLTSIIPSLSFEFTLIQRDVAMAALKRCTVLGYTRFNAVLGESLSFAFPETTDADTVRAWLSGLPDEANSGDIYASPD